MQEAIHQEAVPLDRGLAMDLHQMSLHFPWSITMRHLLLEDLLVLLVRFRNFPIRIRY